MIDELLIRRRDVLDLASPDRAVTMQPRQRAAAAEAVEHPRATLRLFVERASTKTSWDGWLSGATIVLHESAGSAGSDGNDGSDGEGPARALVAPLPWLPLAIATITGLGVRSVPSGSRAIVSREDLRAALDGGHPIDGLGAVHALWTLDWRAVQSAGAGMTILDQGHGDRLWRMDGQTSTGELHLADVGAVAVWCQLARIEEAVSVSQ